jgi:hypothetical protein
VQKNAQIISSKARAKGKHERGTTLFLLEEGTASAAISSAKKRRGGETARGGAGRDEPTAREYLERERRAIGGVFVRLEFSLENKFAVLLLPLHSDSGQRWCNK